MYILSLSSYFTGMGHYVYLQAVEAKQKYEEPGGIIFLSETQQTNQKS